MIGLKNFNLPLWSFLWESTKAETSGLIKSLNFNLPLWSFLWEERIFGILSVWCGDLFQSSLMKLSLRVNYNYIVSADIETNFNLPLWSFLWEMAYYFTPKPSIERNFNLPLWSFLWEDCFNMVRLSCIPEISIFPYEAFFERWVILNSCGGWCQ